MSIDSMPRKTARLCPGCPNGSDLITDDDTIISYASVDEAAVCAVTRFVVDRNGPNEHYAYMPQETTIDDIADCHEPNQTPGGKYSTGPIVGCGAAAAAEKQTNMVS